MAHDRRQFLQAFACASVGTVFPGMTALGNSGTAPKPIELSAPLTHSDWMLKQNAPPWGEAGVRQMLDTCKECGWTHIYWRVFDAGVSTYKSKLLRAGCKPEPDNYFAPASEADLAARQRLTPTDAARAADILKRISALDYNTFDSLAAAVDYGHSIGLKIHAWATINEDDHGWGWPSEFSKAHPEFRWVKRDGTQYRSQLSFAFPEVREYKLALIEEIITGYDIDGLFLDWIRTGDIRDNPQTDEAGVANSGYELPNVEVFRAKYEMDPQELPNDDDRWLRVRAEPQTEFMRALRKRTAKHEKPLPVAVMVGHPWHYRGTLDPIDGNLRGLLLDVGTWAREGLMDAAIAAGYYRSGGDAVKAYESLQQETNGKCDLWYYGWVPQTPADFARDTAAAESLDARRLLYWEADYIADRPAVNELKMAMREYANPSEPSPRR